MKRFLSVSVSGLLGFVLALVLLVPRLPVRAGGGATRETRTPGDTNCDGQLDMSDAVFTLNYLFMGTAFPPCPIADPPELVARIAELEETLASCRGELEATTAGLMATQESLIEAEAALSHAQADLEFCRRIAARGLQATGQTLCYDDENRVIDCANPDFPGQDGFYQTGCSREGRFRDNGDGTVTDHCTGLMWQKGPPSPGEQYGDTEGGFVTWQNGLKYCEELAFAGHADWRLPNLEEACSLLVDDFLVGVPNACGGYRLDCALGFFTIPGHRQAIYFWTSTTSHAGEGSQAIYYDAQSHSIAWQSKKDKQHIRAVRGPIMP